MAGAFLMPPHDALEKQGVHQGALLAQSCCNVKYVVASLSQVLIQPKRSIIWQALAIWHELIKYSLEWDLRIVSEWGSHLYIKIHSSVGELLEKYMLEG